MADVFSKEKRSEIMSKIRAKDTKIEIKVRHWLYHHGIRYRKNCKDIIGHPDIAIKKYRIAIFINGCFWHGHENCKLYRLPKTREEFWSEKIKRNKARDERDYGRLADEGWNVFVLWECQIKSSFNETANELVKCINEIKYKYI